jgi:hypothetical protein
VVHICARCGLEMAYIEKHMLYFYRVRNARASRYGSFEYTRPFKTLKLNLCPDCAEYMQKVVLSECSAEGEARRN